MSVQQHVLNWLYSVLTSEYHDVNRAYNDVAQALSQYPSLSPRTDVHTFDNGASALLLHLSGTIPVNFRGTTYRFPVSIWVPHAYPRDAPLVYVTPTESMMVRPGQHIDPQGQVYHPYLVGWSAFWDKSTIVDFLAILRDVFAKEPPVIARPQGGRHSAAVSTTQQWCGQGPPPLPPPPPVHAPGFPSLSATRALPDSYGPPPPPPKGTGPPLPPLPKDPDSLDHSGGSPRTQQLTRPRSEKFSRYDAAPPLPLTHQASSPPAIAAGFQQQQIRRPLDPGHQFLDRTPGSHRALFASSSDQTVSRSLGVSFSREGGTGQFQPHLPRQQHSNHQLSEKRDNPPAADLLDGSLMLSIPSPSAVAAPPIPPNPEKDALLQQLASTLHSLRQHSRRQNESSMSGLQAQRSAMLSALTTIQSEMGSLDQTSLLLQSNANILVEALRKADLVIEGSALQTPPDIDELLVAPTVVANQLYNVVAEERALGDTVFVLGRAVERGRVSPTVFAKTTRSLAREWYLKKALVRKIGKGMGLLS